jgi:hypothetical protein
MRALGLLLLAACHGKPATPSLAVATLAGPLPSALAFCGDGDVCRETRAVAKVEPPFTGALVLEREHRGVVYLLPALATSTGWYVADFGPYVGGAHGRGVERAELVFFHGRQTRLHFWARTGEGVVQMFCAFDASGALACSRPILIAPGGDFDFWEEELEVKGRDAVYLPGPDATPDLQVPRGRYQVF